MSNGKAWKRNSLRYGNISKAHSSESDFFEREYKEPFMPTAQQLSEIDLEVIESRRQKHWRYN